jgi:hypothetical protein
MQKHKLLALAERVERLTGRETDAEIARQAWGWGNSGDHWFDGILGEVELPAFTTSIDAAMTLVPTNHEWSVDWAGNSQATVGALPDGPTYRGEADTPAQSLTAAALRAIAERTDHD